MQDTVRPLQPVTATAYKNRSETFISCCSQAEATQGISDSHRCFGVRFVGVWGCSERLCAGKAAAMGDGGAAGGRQGVPRDENTFRRSQRGRSEGSPLISV